MTKLVRVIDMDRCMGCRACIAACSVENHCNEDTWNVMNEYELGRYPHVRTLFATMGCMHCEDAPCKKVCDEIGVHAISKNALGVVLIDYGKCIGCDYCSAVCPYGALQHTSAPQTLYPESATPYETADTSTRHPTHRQQPGKVEKCTFCWHKLEPAVAAGKVDRIGKDPQYTPSCDLVCPVNARLFGDLDDSESEVSRYIAEKGAAQLKKEFGTGPQVFYVGDAGDL